MTQISQKNTTHTPSDHWVIKTTFALICPNSKTVGYVLLLKPRYFILAQQWRNLGGFHFTYQEEINDYSIFDVIDSRGKKGLGCGKTMYRILL